MMSMEKSNGKNNMVVLGNMFFIKSSSDESTAEKSEATYKNSNHPSYKKSPSEG